MIVIIILSISLTCLVLPMFWELGCIPLRLDSSLKYDIVRSVSGSNGSDMNGKLHKPITDVIDWDTVHSNHFKNDHLVGTLQIPYSGLATRSLTPSLAQRLGLDNTTRGDVITDIVPGSPAESLGLRPLNLSRSGSTEEIIASRGDIILAVDGNASFTTEYRTIDQYLFENNRVGENITLNLLHDGQLRYVELTIGAMPRFLWYENREEGRIKYPSDWIVLDEESQTDEAVIQINSAEKSPLTKLPVVNASVLKYPSRDSDTSRSFDPNIRKEIKSVRILDINVTELDNLSAYSSIYYDYSMANDTRKILTVFTEKDSDLYSIIFSIVPSKYDDYYPLIKEMIKSFKFG
jgi:PDZ domain/PsbP-like protein